MRGRIADRQLRELGELLAAEQHDEGVLADEHAGGGLVGERWVVAKPKRREERLAALEIRHGEVHEQHAARVCSVGHGGSPVGRSMTCFLVDRASWRNSSMTLHGFAVPKAETRVSFDDAASGWWT